MVSKKPQKGSRHGGSRKGAGRKPAIGTSEMLYIKNEFGKISGEALERRAVQRKISKDRDKDATKDYLEITKELRDWEETPLKSRTKWIDGVSYYKLPSEEARDIADRISIVRGILGEKGKKRRKNSDALSSKNISGNLTGRKIQDEKDRDSNLEEVAKRASKEFGKPITKRMVRKALATKRADLIIDALENSLPENPEDSETWINLEKWPE